ncbi:hypothetical protein HAX54_010126 [Datura stramonium]|uniref:Uncharacterized protein n=1 Tax=Datura stramonium TaxID=4076 RepID=A0ABS8THM3_DATST|nr:hypothetical protein [Datura stramonium]
MEKKAPSGYYFGLSQVLCGFSFYEQDLILLRDLAGVEKDDVVSNAINEVVASYQEGDATRTDDDYHNCGGGYTPLAAGDAGGAGGRYTPASEEVRHQEDTPYTLGIPSVVEAQGVTEAAINKLISKRGIYPSSRISESFTLIAVKRRRNQISRALKSAKKKVAGTLKMMADQPTERLPVNLYKYADDKKKKKIQQMIKLKRSTKILYTMHEFNYQDFECMNNMDKWWED